MSERVDNHDAFDDTGASTVEPVIFFTSSRPVRTWKAILAVPFCAAFSVFPSMVIIDVVRGQSVDTMPMIMGFTFGALFAYLCLVSIVRLVKGGVVELVVSTEGVKCEQQSWPWSMIYYFGPAPGSKDGTVQLSIRTRPMAVGQPLAAFRVLDAQQPVSVEDYRQLAARLIPFLSRHYSHVKVP